MHFISVSSTKLKMTHSPFWGLGHEKWNALYVWLWFYQWYDIIVENMLTQPCTIDTVSYWCNTNEISPIANVSCASWEAMVYIRVRLSGTLAHTICTLVHIAHGCFTAPGSIDFPNAGDKTLKDMGKIDQYHTTTIYNSDKPCTHFLEVIYITRLVHKWQIACYLYLPASLDTMDRIATEMMFCHHDGIWGAEMSSCRVIYRKDAMIMSLSRLGCR